MSRHHSSIPILVVLAVFASAPSRAIEAIPVDTALTLENGNWFPLPAADMRAASADAALAEISGGGWLRVVPTGSEERAGTLGLAISLIGRAETAKLTLTLDLADGPTTVSTASISVRGLDHQGFFGAFEHIGRSAAARLNARIEALGITASRPASLRSPGLMANDPQLQGRFDEAQGLKHAGNYPRARVLFEQVADATGAGAERLVEMARDELRYGLPVFEARRSILELGRLVNAGPDRFEPAIARAEQLYRQIQAENPHDVARVQEAQRALDELQVSRQAIDNAMRAQAMSRVSHVRMMLLEHLYADGECLPEDQLREAVERLPTGLELQGAESRGERGLRYSILDTRSGVVVRLSCDRDVRVEAS